MLFQSPVCSRDMKSVVNIQASLVRGNNFQRQVINCDHCSTERHFSVSIRAFLLWSFVFVWCDWLIFVKCVLWNWSFAKYICVNNISEILVTDFFPPQWEKIFFSLSMTSLIIWMHRIQPKSTQGRGGKRHLDPMGQQRKMEFLQKFHAVQL